jgi:hypothetical protein
MPSIGFDCLMCGAPVEGADEDAVGDAFVTHVRGAHPELPYPDVSIRNVAAAIPRQTGPVERLASLGEVEIRSVTEDRIDDWLAFFDHDAFSDSPIFASCYCTEPHVVDPKNWDPNHQPTLDSPGNCWTGRSPMLAVAAPPRSSRTRSTTSALKTPATSAAPARSTKPMASRLSRCANATR